MRTGIATVSLSGLLTDKLAAVAAAGFDGVEIFDNDLISCPSSPQEIAKRCADLGLAVDLFQPVRDVEGVPPAEFPAVLRRLRTKLGIAGELGASTVLACSNARADAVDDPALTAAQLHEVGELAASYGITVAYEALAWGRHVDRVGQAWLAVQAADHPSVTLAVDTFHMLARGDDSRALAGVPGERIGFLQVADAPLMDMNVLEWSRHHRCFPGQGTLDVTGVVAAVLGAGYAGPVSLEVFSDVVREASPEDTARDAMRSLVFLEDQLARAGAAGAVEAAPPPAQRADAAFVELASPPGSTEVTGLLAGLGFTPAGRHRSKPVTWWRNGGAHVVVNETVGSRPAATALGVVAPPVAAVADRAHALRWPAVQKARGADEALLPGLGLPFGLHLLLSDEPGGADDWQRDFVAVYDAEPDTELGRDGWTGLDHVGVAVEPEHVNETISFFRTVLDLAPSPVEEFMEPHGRLRSRALRPVDGALRVVVNVADRGPGAPPPHGVTQLAFAVPDVAAAVDGLRQRDVPLMRVPDNYYVDLAARFGLGREEVAHLREHGLLYDRIGDGELLHAYTPVLGPGFYVELLERRGGYDAYGAANTVVRLAAQSAQAEPGA